MTNKQQENLYEVEAILRHRKTNKGMSYYLKWKGYPLSDATWEDEANLGCPVLLASYWEEQNRKKQATLKQTTLKFSSPSNKPATKAAEPPSKRTKDLPQNPQKLQRRSNEIPIKVKQPQQQKKETESLKVTPKIDVSHLDHFKKIKGTSKEKETARETTIGATIGTTLGTTKETTIGTTKEVTTGKANIGTTKRTRKRTTNKATKETTKKATNKNHSKKNSQKLKQKIRIIAPARNKKDNKIMFAVEIIEGKKVRKSILSNTYMKSHYSAALLKFYLDNLEFYSPFESKAPDFIPKK